VSKPYADIVADIVKYQSEADDVEYAAKLARDIASIFEYAASRVAIARAQVNAGGES
jgi:hypothetical protein